MITTNTLPPPRQGSAHHSVDSFGARRWRLYSSAPEKLAGTAQMVELFDKVGLGKWFRYLTGLLEVAGGIGLLIPRYAFYAAILLVIVMMVHHHTSSHSWCSPAPSACYLPSARIIAWVRKP